MEHKSYRDAKSMTQMRIYQNGLYERGFGPALPLIVYHGPERDWGGALEFQASLQHGSALLRKRYGGEFLNFRCRLLNLHDVIESHAADGMKSEVVLYAMSRVWAAQDDAMRKVFERSKRLERSTREELLAEVMDYWSAIHPWITEELIMKIEQEVMQEGERVMLSVFEKRERIGIKKGIEQGREQGIERVAVRMMHEGVQLSKICQYTGLKFDHVEQLQHRLNNSGNDLSKP